MRDWFSRYAGSVSILFCLHCLRRSFWQAGAEQKVWFLTRGFGRNGWPQQAQILVLITFLHTKIRMGTAGHLKAQGVNQ